MYRFWIVLFYSTLVYTSSGQLLSPKDSLERYMHTQASDSLRLDALLNFVALNTDKTENIALLDSARNRLSDVKGMPNLLMIRLNLTLSAQQYFQNQYRASMGSVFRVKRLATKARDTANLITANNNLNILYYRLSKYDSALFYLNQNYDLLKTSKDTFAIAGNLNGLGLYYLQKDEFEKASQYFHTIKSLGHQTSDSALHERLLALAYSNLGILFNDLDIPDSAAFYAQQHLSIIPNAIGALNTLGSVYKDKGNLDSALFYYQKVYTHAREKENINLQSGSANNMAIVLNMQGNYRSALHFARTGKEMATKTGRLEWIRVGLEEEMKALAGLGRYKEAFGLNDKLKEVSDSLNGLEVRERMAELETTYNLKERTRELELSQAQNQLQQAALEKEKLRIRLAITGLVILLLVAGVIIFLYVRLRKIRTALAESNAIKDRFFAVVAHDLRGGFGGFSGIGPVIDKMLKNGNHQGIQKITGQLERESLRLEKLLDSLLQWAFLQLDRINMKPVQVDVQTVITGRLEELHELIQKKSLHLEVELGVKQVFVDPDALVFILRNLLSNAIKFSHQGGRIKLRSENSGKKVALHIQDEGTGMSEEVIAKIFETGEKVTQTGTSGERGNGIGLTLSKEFAERNNGYIRVESREGHGSDFIVYLPVP